MNPRSLELKLIVYILRYINIDYMFFHSLAGTELM